MSQGSGFRVQARGTSPQRSEFRAGSRKGFGVGHAGMGLMGLEMLLFVPNLSPGKGLLGGAMGGAVGTIGFLLIAMLYQGVAGDLAGRMLAGLLLGSCLGPWPQAAGAPLPAAYLTYEFDLSKSSAPLRGCSACRPRRIAARGGDRLPVLFFSDCSRSRTGPVLLPGEADSSPPRPRCAVFDSAVKSDSCDTAGSSA
jgi:hypothetical protein